MWPSQCPATLSLGTCSHHVVMASSNWALQHAHAGVDVRRLLAADPDWLLRAQRGKKRLGEHPDSVLNEQV